MQNDIPTKVKKDIKLATTTKMSQTFNGWLGIKDIFSTETEYYTTKVCTHCGICERICPVGNIKCTPTTVNFGNNCLQCMACIQWCPPRAIAHPNVPEKRKRYHNPNVTLTDMLNLAKGEKLID